MRVRLFLKLKKTYKRLKNNQNFLVKLSKNVTLPSVSFPRYSRTQVHQQKSAQLIQHFRILLVLMNRGSWDKLFCPQAAKCLRKAGQSVPYTSSAILNRIKFIHKPKNQLRRFQDTFSHDRVTASWLCIEDLSST